MEDSLSSEAVRRRYDIPPDAGLAVSPGEVRVALPGFENVAREVATRPDRLPASGQQGRRGLGRLVAGDGPVLVRESGKGGLLRHLRGRRFRGPWRPLAEFALLRRLLAAGVPVPEAVGAVILPGRLGWRGFLLTREIVGALDLERVLYGDPLPAGLRRGPVLTEAGRAVRRLHDAGVMHADLHPKNLLLTEDGRVLVIDLDRAKAAERPLADEARLSNLTRLGRAVEKHRLRGMPSGRKEALRFLRGYAGSREAADAWLDRIRARLAPTLGVRILWWRLIGQARPRAVGGAGGTSP